jgi:hypothetical protein
MLLAAVNHQPMMQEVWDMSLTSEVGVTGSDLKTPDRRGWW